MRSFARDKISTFNEFQNIFWLNLFYLNVFRKFFSFFFFFSEAERGRPKGNSLIL